MKKVCRQCKQSVRLADYYQMPKMADGLMAICKACHKGNVRDNYLRNREHYREYERGRATMPHRVELRQAYSQTPDGKAAHQRAHKRQKELRPLHRAARVAVGNALRDGKLIRQPCEVCGNPKAQAHHCDYGKPLEVMWLCTTHHAAWHKENDPIVPASDLAA